MDLHAPLGKGPPPPRRRLLPILVAVLVASGVAGLGAYFFQADLHGGQPFAIATIPPAPAQKAAAPAAPAQTDPTSTGSIGSGKSSNGDVTRFENGVKVVSPPPEGGRAESQDSGPLVIDVSKALDGGMRKKSASPGRSATAALPNKAAAEPPHARIAIFVGGMGLSEGATRTATEIMPAAVSLAFVPYDVKVQASVAAAKAKGHEVLLQLPMQNAQGALPGPHALTTKGIQVQTTNDLNWLMGRFDGYVGVTNLLGAPVTSNASMMTAILKAVRQKGLFYVDDGTSRRSLGPSVAQTLDMPAIQADVVLDATGDPAVVQTNLQKLAAIARTKGSAIGFASGLSDHLAVIARFAANLDSQGLTLVPVSTLARGNTSLATTR